VVIFLELISRYPILLALPVKVLLFPRIMKDEEDMSRDCL
jgi:hypothetical protein